MKKGFDEKRIGVITASQLHKVINVTSDKMSRTAQSYLIKVFSEQFISQEFYEETVWNRLSTPAIGWGNDHEEEAINYFNLIQSSENINLVAKQNEGFAYDHSIRFGATTDAFIVDNYDQNVTKGCLEVKCPYEPANQMKRFVEGIPREYYWQCVGQLLVLHKIDQCYFASYDPRVENKYKLYTKIIHRSDIVDDMNRAIAALKICNEYIDRLVGRLCDE